MAAPDLIAPDELASVFDSPEFAALPAFQRAEMVDAGLAQSRDWLKANAGDDETLSKAFDETTQAMAVRYRPADSDIELSRQSPAMTVVNQVRNVGPGLVGGLMSSGGRVLDTAAEGVARMTGTERGGFFADVADVGDRLQEAGQELRPVSPTNPIASTIGSGLQQGLGMLATMGAAAPLVGTRAAMTTVPLVTGGIRGAGEGVQTARDLGIDNPAGQLATGAAFAGAEMLSERLGGIGASQALTSGLRAAGKTVLSEAIEEPLAGTMQEAATAAAGQFVADPNRPGFTITGQPLPNMQGFAQRRALEALGGAAGGTVFAGLQLAAGAGSTPAPTRPAPVLPSNSSAITPLGDIAAGTFVPDPLVAENLGDLTAADVADLEPATGKPDLQVLAPQSRQPILSNVPDRAPAGVGQTVSESGQVVSEPVPVPTAELPRGAAAPKFTLPPGSQIASDVYRSEGAIQITGEPVWNAEEQNWKYPALTQGGRAFTVAERFIDQVVSQPVPAAEAAQPVPLELMTPAQAAELGVAMDVQAARQRYEAAREANDPREGMLAEAAISAAQAGTGRNAQRVKDGRMAAVDRAVAEGRPVNAAALEQWAQVPIEGAGFDASGNIPRRGIPAGYQKQGDVYTTDSGATSPDARPTGNVGSGAAVSAAAEGGPVAVLQRLNAELPETARAKWTPEVYAKAGRYLETGREAELEGLTPIQKRRVIQARLDTNPAARAEQEKADRKAEHKMRSQEKKDAAFEQRTTFKNLVIDRDLEAGFMSDAGVDALFDLANTALKAGKTFVQWSAEMVRRFGEQIRDYLAHVWEAATKRLPTTAAENVRLGAAAKNAPVNLAQGGFVTGPNRVEETRSRFARPEKQERLYEVRADVDVKASAEAWLDSLPMAEAVSLMESGRLPEGMTGDVAQHAAGLLIQRTTEMMKSGSEVVQMQARSLGHRISKVWQGWLSQEAGRNMRQRSVVSSELTPYAPILAAEGMLIDRADAVMDKRFEGGAEGGAAKVNDTAADAGDEAGDTLADDLDGDTPALKDAKKQVRKQMAPAKKKLSKAQKTADRILEQLSERYADPPLMDANGLRKVDPVRALYKKHVQTPMVEADFVQQMVGLGVPEGLAGTLWEASRLEIEARETLRLMAEAERAATKDARQIEVAENRASRLIYRTEERLRQGSKDLSRSTDGDSINKVFRDKVKDDIGWEAFRDRLAKLRVGEEIAARLWRTAERERIDQAAMVRFREERKAGDVRRGILATGSQKLRQMLNDLRKKIAPDMTWADIFMELPASQKARQREIYRRLLLDERLKGLTKDERLALTNELDKAWQQERRKVFLRELERVGIGEKAAADKAKVVKALPKLIRLINLGMMNSEMFRETVAPEYGLKQITTGQALSLRKLAEEAYAMPEGVLRSRKLAGLLDGIQKSTGTALPEVLNQYWVAAVLSGMRTQFDTFMSVTNGFGNQLIQSGMLALKNRNRAAAVVSMLEWWRGLKQAFPEAMQILAKGDYSYLKRFNEDLKKALEGESTFRPVPLGEALWRDGNAMEKYGFAPIMIFTGRLMAAADHLNNSATTAGAKVVARALHPELYKTVAASQAEREAAAAQARREVTGGEIPATAQERATLAARTREILNGQLRPEEVKEASFMGDQAAYQNDPVGVFGAIYRAVNQGLGSLERGLQAYADEQGTDGPAGQYARGLMLFLSGSMRSMMGAKFIRFGANFGNDMLGYVPGTVLVSPALLGKEATRSQQQLLMGKNVFGLMAGLTVAAMFLGKDDEEEGWHLEGPWTDLTPEEIKQRRAAGFEPLTFWKRTADKVQRVSYKQWPTAGLLAGVAHMQDRQRFRPQKWAQEGMAGHLLAAASVGAFQVKDVSAMRGLADLLGASKFGTNPEEAFVEKMSKVPINFAGGFIPTLAKDLDALADPRRYKPATVMEEFMRNVPVLRQRVANGRPEINILGLPIEQDRKPWSRAYTDAESGVAQARLAELMGRGFNLPTPETNRKVWRADGLTTIEALGADTEWRYQKAVGDGYRAWLSSPESAELLSNPDGLAVQRVINRKADAIKRQAVAKVVQ